MTVDAFFYDEEGITFIMLFSELLWQQRTLKVFCKTRSCNFSSRISRAIVIVHSDVMLPSFEKPI